MATFTGSLRCPRCGQSLSREMPDIVRKADAEASIRLECPKCEGDIVVELRIIHHVVIKPDGAEVL